MKLNAAHDEWEVAADLTRDLIIKDRRGRHCFTLPATMTEPEIIERIKLYAAGRKHGREQARSFFHDRIERFFKEAVL